MPTVLEVRPRSSHTDLCYWHLSGPSGRAWIYRPPTISRVFNRFNYDYLCWNIRALSLPIAHCAQFTEVRFTQLERFSVILTLQAEISPMRRHHHNVSPIAGERLMHVEDDLKMECPVLRELQLVCYRSDPRFPPARWRVSTAEICEFIEGHLLLSETHFERVHLCNLRLDVGDDPAVPSALRTRYGTVTVSSQSEPPELAVANSFWSATGTRLQS